MRPYHSPSSLALGARCEAAWAWQYVAGLREPEVSWDDILAGAKWSRSQRATALGKAMHKVGEDWYRGLAPAWSSLPGQVFASGLHLLPQPSKCEEIEVERAVGTEPSGIVEEGRPPTVLIVDGVRFAGFRDLAVRSEEEFAKFKWTGATWALFDYKSSANISRYAKTAADLIVDPQCNLYALDLMLRHDLQSLPARWVYFETKDVRRAKPVDVLIERQRAHDLLAALAPLARRLDAIEDPALAICNTDACADYGGCPHHISAGGPCLARRKLGALIQLKGKRETTMPIDPNVRASFQAELARRSGAVATSTEDPAADIAPTVAEPPVEAPKPARAPRARKAAPPVEAPVVEAPVLAPTTEGLEVEVRRPAATILRLSTDLAEAQASLDVAEAEHEAASLKLHDAQGAVARILSEIKGAL